MTQWHAWITTNSHQYHSNEKTIKVRRLFWTLASYVLAQKRISYHFYIKKKILQTAAFSFSINENNHDIARHFQACCEQVINALLMLAETERGSFTFPLVFDVIPDVEVNGDVSTDTGRPVLSNVWLRHLHDRKRRNGLCHSSPSSKHHSSILRLPAGHMADHRQFFSWP